MATNTQRRVPLAFAVVACSAAAFIEVPIARGQGASSTAGKPRITVGTNVHVSKAFPNMPHGEIHVAADPNDARRLLGGSMAFTEEAHNRTHYVAYVSFDGGATWETALHEQEGTDPAAGFSPDGTAWLLRISHSPAPQYGLRTEVHRSKDGGRTWLKPVPFEMYDRHFVVIDHSQSKYRGWFYAPGFLGPRIGLDGTRVSNRLGLLRSRDGGETFEEVEIASGGRPRLGLAPGAVLSDGTLAIPFMDAEQRPADGYGSPATETNATVNVALSSDGGTSFGKASVVGAATLGNSILGQPYHFAFAADTSSGPFKDRIYVAWSNSYGESANIVVCYSPDKGQTWSKPIVVNDDQMPLDVSKGPTHIAPVLAVNRDGVVGIRWGDRRDSSNRIDWRLRFSASLDGGDTWLPSVAVSEAPFLHRPSDRAELSATALGGGNFSPYNSRVGGGPIRLDVSLGQFYISGGHTAGMAAAADGVFHPWWVDNRTGVAQIYTARVLVDGKAVRHGATELSALHDVSERALMSYSYLRYDPATGDIAVAAQIQNVAKEQLTPPLKIRAIGLKSPAGGILTIRNANNAVTSTGAIWDFTSALPAGGLKPGEKTTPMTLQFNIRDLPPLDQRMRYRYRELAGSRLPGWGGLQLVQLEARVFANVEAVKSTTATQGQTPF